MKDFGFDMMGVFPYSQEPGTPMGRMEDQLPEPVKQQRVEELMLAQQEVAFAKARSMKGKTIEVLIDRPAGRDAGRRLRRPQPAPGAGHRFGHFRPRRRAASGQLVDVKVTDFQAYDLVAQVPKKKSAQPCRHLR